MLARHAAGFWGEFSGATGVVMARWRPRFRLRTLLVLTGVSALVLAPVAVEFNQQPENRRSSSG